MVVITRLPPAESPASAMFCGGMPLRGGPARILRSAGDGVIGPPYPGRCLRPESRSPRRDGLLSGRKHRGGARVRCPGWVATVG